MSDLNTKVKKAESGIILYSLTPPVEKICNDKLYELNRRRAARISTIDIDGISIYDVQEEKDRNSKQRTFPYRPAMDPLAYGASVNDHMHKEQIVYLVAGKYDEEELINIFENNRGRIFIPVGSPEKNSMVKTSLKQALKIAQRFNNSIGSVLIGERHRKGSNEVERMLFKENMGVDFFISQCIYDGSLYKKLLSDYAEESLLKGRNMKPLILTFSPIGDKSSLSFMKWLGIEIGEDFSAGIPESDTFLEYSVQYLIETGKNLIDFSLERNIPIGLNFESVIGRRSEVLASLKLAEELTDYLKFHPFNSFTRNLKSGESALSRR